MSSTEKQKVIEAIGELGRRVTTADIAGKTGLPVLTVQRLLNEVAADVGGHLQVGNSGDIVYGFAPGFSNAYLAKGIQAAFEGAFAKICQVGLYLLRISFGIALILSLIVVVVLIIALTLVLMRGSDRDDRDGGSFNLDWLSGGDGFHFSFWDWMILRDLLWWNSYNYAPVVYDYRKPTVRKRQSNFLLNCFSFLFGDGDPNEGLLEKKWQVIAQVIQKNQNVVTAEQLAPYTGAGPGNEDAVLPVLVRFNGRPEVTDKGNIVYVFDSFQTTAAGERNTFNIPSYLQEFPWRLTNVDQGELMPVYIVAGLNLFGGWTLFNLMHRLRLDGSNPAAMRYWQDLNGLVAAICAYGLLFVFLPAIRGFLYYMRNLGIKTRNAQREQYAAIINKPDAKLQEKLAEAAQYRLASRQISAKDIVYSTDKDTLDQADALSNKFQELENQQRDKVVRIPNKPQAGEPEDQGQKLKIVEKVEQEFDASP